MRCAAAKKFISDYIDQNLDPDKTQALKKHIGECRKCRLFLEDFKKISTSAKELQELSPPGKTWLKIKAGMRQEMEKVTLPSYGMKRRFAFSLQPKLSYAVSAVALLAVVVGLVTIGPRFWNRGRMLSLEDRDQYTLAKIEEAEKHYQKAIEALLDAVKVQERDMDPQVAMFFRKNLELIDTSLDYYRQIMRNEPDDIEARNFLLATYQSKVDLLSTMMANEEGSSQMDESDTIL